MSKRNAPDSQKTFLIVGGIFIIAIFVLLLFVGILGGNEEDTTPDANNNAPIIGVG